MSFRFRDGERLGEGAIRIAREQAGRAADLLDSVSRPGAGLDEAVHEARKRIKKARAVLRLARRAIGPRRARSVDRKLRDAARPLGQARDASALRGTLDDLARPDDGPDQVDAFEGARRALDDRRTAASRALLDEGRAASRSARALRSVRARLGRWDVDDDRKPTSGLKRAYRRARSAFGTALQAPSPDTLHEWRKRVKDLAYQLRALGGGPDGAAARSLRLAELLGAELGELHDLDVLQDGLGGPGLGAIGPRVEHRRDDLRRAAFARGFALFGRKPRAFTREVVRSLRPARAKAPD